MNQSLQQFLRSASARVPFCAYLLQLRAQRRYDKKFPTEARLLRQRHSSENAHPSIIHFSLNKAATQSVRAILTRCALEQGMTLVRLHDYAFATPFPYLDELSAEEMRRYQHLFKSRGHLYSAFGGMVEGIPGLADYKVVLLVRDPRDILVSLYFSLVYSHSLPSIFSGKRDAFLAYRAWASSVTLDEFVCAESQKIRAIFERYERVRLKQPISLHLTSYEGMVTQFRSWLTELLGYCELPITEKLFQTLLEEQERTVPQVENIKLHIRKGRPGDFREKLTQQSIDYLNQVFADVLPAFGYVV